MLKVAHFIFFLGCASEEIDPIPDELQFLKDLTIYSANEKPQVNITFTKETVFNDSQEVLIGKIGDVVVLHLYPGNC